MELNFLRSIGGKKEIREGILVSIKKNANLENSQKHMLGCSVRVIKISEDKKHFKRGRQIIIGDPWDCGLRAVVYEKDLFIPKSISGQK